MGTYQLLHYKHQIIRTYQGVRFAVPLHEIEEAHPAFLEAASDENWVMMVEGAIRTTAAPLYQPSASIQKQIGKIHLFALHGDLCDNVSQIQGKFRSTHAFHRARRRILCTSQRH